METVKITINGEEITAPAGSTVLQVADQAGIYIPTLCHHSALKPIGACRICLVEVKGERNLQTACTFPVRDGMVVETETPALIKARKFILSMLLSERNHFCPFCEMSGSCELQDLAYRYGLEHFIYEAYTKRYPIDATHKHLILDHNRCILCARCIRACEEIAANHTLGLGKRGSATLLKCDTDTPWGESTCISCGTCAQVCPTGAIIDRRSSYMGKTSQIRQVKSSCNRCSIACGFQISVKGDHIIRVDSDWESPVNGGLLCERGRFRILEEKRTRITSPMVRRKGKLYPTTWDEALEVTANSIKSLKEGKLGVYVSGDITNEALFAIKKMFPTATKNVRLGTLSNVAPRPLDGAPASLSEIAASDAVLIVQEDLHESHPVAAYLVKRSIDQGSKLYIIDDNGENTLSPFASGTFAVKEIESVVKLLETSLRPVVLYGANISNEMFESLKKLQGKASFIPLERGLNFCAAANLGINGVLETPIVEEVLYVVAGDDYVEELKVDEAKKPFLIVQSSYLSPIVKHADVLLPSTNWSERIGTVMATDGRIQTMNQATEIKGEAKQDWEILSLLGGKLGLEVEPFEELSKDVLKALSGKEHA
ncbi:MAG: molybdopterin-dependent oxidoreductase [Syntrophales bacterium]|nr:molybdopterin-dependent oxidoreductase [Syntrophales bacterium]